MPEEDEKDAIAQRIATSVKDQIETDNSSRRSFLGRSALAGGALLALGGGTGVALAENHEGGNPAEKMTANFDDVAGTDVDVLNYALTLEHLEDVFYREGLDTFGEQDFVDAEALQSFDEEYRRQAFTYVQSVGEHEATHVEVLTQAVELLGGDPAPEGNYEFGVESVGDMLALGQVFENTGVAAYAGAAPFIESPDLLGAAVSIHSVEARHAAFLNQLNAESPAPDAFDSALSQEDVLDAVSPFIVADDGGEEEETPETGSENTQTPTNETG